MLREVWPSGLLLLPVGGMRPALVGRPHALRCSATAEVHLVVLGYSTQPSGWEQPGRVDGRWELKQGCPCKLLLLLQCSTPSTPCMDSAAPQCRAP